VRSGRRWLLSVAAVLLIGALAACGKDDDTPQAKLSKVQPKSLGFIGDLTNDDFAKAALQGATIGVAPSTQPGTLVRIDIAKLDTGGDASKVAPLLQGFLDDKELPPRLAVIVALRGEALKTAGDLLSKAGTGFLVLASDLPSLADRGWQGGVRVVTTTANEAKAAARVAAEASAGKGACIATGDSSDGFAEATSTELTAAGVTPTSVPASGASSAVTSAGCGVVVAGGDAGAAGALRKELDGAGLQDLAMVVNSAAVGSAFGAGTAQAVCACAVPSMSKSTAATQFSDQFQAEFSSEPPPFAAEGRDAATVVLQGTRAAYLDQPGMVQWFGIASGVPGVNGSLSFGPDGELASPPFVSLLATDGSGWTAKQADLLSSATSS
jgi:hypothetical protein